MSSLKLTSPLATINWLHTNLQHPDMVILDASMQNPITTTERIKEAPNQQIPGSRYFDIKNIFSDTTSELPNTFPSAELFELEAQKLGINSTSLIVVYDRTGIYSSPRVWWLFTAMGHENIVVLNGGFPSWLQAELPTEPKKDSNWQRGNFKSKFDPTLIVNASQVLEATTNPEYSILDARSPDRFDGIQKEPRPGMRSGHIPNSQNLHYQQLLHNGQMRPAEELSTIFHELQLERKHLIFSCGSGITACILALSADILGYKDRKLYDGSWSEWGRTAHLPIS